jgi:large subunit ribosomal protein L25
VTLAVEPEILVLHVLAAPTAEQMEAELGLPEEPAAVEAAAGAEAAESGAEDAGDSAKAESDSSEE